jgi:hypothetical protein
MADTDDTNPAPAPPIGDAEMTALAGRLRARADSVYMADQPHQAADLRAAAVIVMSNASLIRRLVRLRSELQRLAAGATDEATKLALEQLLRER